MSTNAGNVVAPRPNIGGGVYIAPSATALPTDSTTALAVGYSSAGYIDKKGVVEKDGTTATKVTAWGGDLVKIVQSDHEVSYQFLMQEALGAVPNQIMYGPDNVTTTAPTATTGTLIAAKVTGEELPHQVFIFDMIDGLATIRVCVPDGQVTAKGDTTYADSGAATYDVTITAYPDANGVNAYKYSDNGVFA